MGTIKCSYCHVQRTSEGACPHCGSIHCYVSIWWTRRGEVKGREYRIRIFTDGFKLDYQRAQAIQGEIRVRIANRKFDPLEYGSSGIKERKFANKVDKWLALKEKEMKKDIIRPSSWANIQGHMGNHLLPFFENFDVKEITKEDLANFRDSLHDIKNKTKKNIFVTLHAFFVWLYQDTAIPVPPFPPLETEDDADPREAMELVDQERALLLVPEGVERDMLELGMELGIRPGELVALKVKDFDLTHRRAQISRTVSQYTHVLEGTKGRKRNGPRKKGFIPLSDHALLILEKYIRGRFPEEWLFICPTTGNRYSVKAPNRIWKKHANSELVYYEASRHSFLTQLSDLGVDVLDLKELARHSDVRTTQKYVHKRMDHLTQKVNLRHNVVELKKTEEPKE